MLLLRRLLLTAVLSGCVLLAGVTAVYAEAGKGLGNTNWGAVFLSFALILVGTPAVIGSVVFIILDLVGQAASSHRGELKRCVKFAYVAWPFSLVIFMTLLSIAGRGAGFWQDIAITLLPAIAAAGLGYYTKSEQS